MVAHQQMFRAIVDAGCRAKRRTEIPSWEAGERRPADRVPRKGVGDKTVFIRANETLGPRTHIGSSLHEWGPAVLRQLHDGFLPRLFLNEQWNWNSPNVYTLYTHGMIRQIAGGRFTTKSGY